MVNADNFMICFQPYELEKTEQALIDYKLLAKRVVHVHYQGRKEKQMELLKNSSLDYKKLTQLLVENKFTGYLSLEFVKDCVVKNSADFNPDLVLQNARRDREYVINVGKDLGIEIFH
jgi:sugar phosphate isomerase/epimerase